MNYTKMINNFYRYLCYIVYQRACKSSTTNGNISKKGAYFSFLLLAGFVPGCILALKLNRLAIFDFLNHLPQRGIVHLLSVFVCFFSIPMLCIALLIKKSFLEQLTLTEGEIKKNRRILWGLIILFIAYIMIKILT